jgi:hypothetical protein
VEVAVRCRSRSGEELAGAIGGGRRVRRVLRSEGDIGLPCCNFRV